MRENTNEEEEEGEKKRLKKRQHIHPQAKIAMAILRYPKKLQGNLEYINNHPPNCYRSTVRKIIHTSGVVCGFSTDRPFK